MVIQNHAIKNYMKINIKIFLSLALLLVLISSCKKLDKPALGDYPKDASAPGGALKFYAAFDGTTADPLMNAVDSIRASFASSNACSSISGISGKAVLGNGSQFVKYISPNDFVGTAKNFTVAFWEKRNGMPIGEAEFPFSIASNNGHWAGTSMMLLFDHAGAGATNSLAVLKFVLVDKNMNDTWLTWEGSNKVEGIQDNNWHHLAFVYNATSSALSLYVDGAANTNVATWSGHGDANMDASNVSGFIIGGRPKEDLGWGRSWTGGIDQFRMYNTALSSADIAALYSGKK